MKLTKVFLVLGLMSALPAIAGAGVSNGGGGLAAVCRVQGAIKSAQLLDLYEARLNGVQLRAATGNLDSDYTAFLTAFRYAAGDNRPVDQSALDDFHKQFDLINIIQTPIPLSNDVGTAPVLPEGCAIEQAAYWDDSNNTLAVSAQIWNSFDSLNQVALYAHEILYKEYRRTVGDWSSQAARKVVPLYFMVNLPPTATQGVPQSAITCNAGSGDNWTRFYIYPDATTGGSILQFDNLFGLHAFAPLRISVPVTIANANLLQGVVGFNLEVQVADSNAHYLNTLDVKDGYLDDQKIGVSYSDGQPFAISLWNKNPMGDQMMSELIVNSCQTTTPVAR